MSKSHARQGRKYSKDEWYNVSAYQKQGYPQCREISALGSRCNQPAAPGKTRCYYHDKIEQGLLTGPSYGLM